MNRTPIASPRCVLGETRQKPGMAPMMSTAEVGLCESIAKLLDNGNPEVIGSSF
jgi:hypothetical protein